MNRLATILAAGMAVAPATGMAFSIELPAGAIETAAAKEANSGFLLPVAPYSAGNVESLQVSGLVETVAWRFPIAAQSTDALVENLAAQIREEGFTPLLSCDDARCGGFDFRFEISVLPEPDMHVDLGDFQFLSAVRNSAETEPEHLQLIVSRSLSNGFVQLTRIQPVEAQPLVTTTKSVEPDSASGDDRTLGERLLADGFTELADLTFGSGSAELDGNDFASLAELADFLRANGDLTVALVGHTDAVGSLRANMVLSKARAESVMSWLIERYGIAPSRLEADGVGYLAPVANNLTEEGRQKNRRVEAIITSTRQ